MTAPTKAAARKVDWNRFNLDGGSLVIYPPREKGPDIPGMVRLFVSEDRGDLAAAGKDEALAATLVRIGRKSYEAREKRQRIVATWCAEAFGADHANSIKQRGIRLLEEAVELFQACNGDAAMAHKLVDFVFGRPVGEVNREIGGVSITLLALASAAGQSADLCEANELERVLSKPLEHFTARNEAKNAAGFNTVAPEGKDRG